MCTTSLTNIDYVDAALCAYTAYKLTLGECKNVGEESAGFILFPGALP